MNIKTRYNVGDRIWHVYEAKNDYGYAGEVSVYDDVIAEIIYDKDGITYSTNYVDIAEKDIILYSETEKLAKRIKEVMNNIHEREKEE